MIALHFFNFRVAVRVVDCNESGKGDSGMGSTRCLLQRPRENVSSFKPG